MKKSLSLILIAVMLFCMNIGAFAKIDSFVVDFDIQAPSTVEKNEEFTVSIGVDMMKDHALSGKIQVGFDTSKIEYISATAIGDNIETEDDFNLSSHFASVVNDEHSGKVIVSFFSYDDCPEDYVKIVEIKFRAKSTGTTAFYVYTDDWADACNGVEYWDSRSDGKPKTNNAVHTISITENKKDYCVGYVIEKPDVVTVGDEFTVSVAVDNMKDHILCCTLEFNYDSDMLDLISFKCSGESDDGSFFSDKQNNYQYSVNDQIADKIIVSFISVNTCVDDVVEFIDLTFVSKKTGVAEIKTTSDAWDDLYNEETLWTINDETSIPNGLEQTISVYVTEPITQYPDFIVEYMLGDVDNDKKITAADARIVLRASAKLETLNDDQKRCAEVNFDNKITVADARMILRVAAKIDNFDIPNPEPSLELSDSELIAYVGDSTLFYAYVKDIDDYEITAEYASVSGSNCSSEDVQLTVIKTDVGAVIAADIADMVLNTRLVGTDYFFEEFDINVSLKDNDGKIVDEEKINIEIRYSDEYIEKYGSPVYLTEYALQNDAELQLYNLLFALENIQGTDVASFGIAVVEIMNATGEVVYSGKHEFMPENFDVWEKDGKEVLFANIEIPYTGIQKGASANGTVSLDIYTPFNIKWNDISFDVSCLPVDETLDIDNPQACIDYGHTVKSGLCSRCSTYIGSDLFIAFADENSNLLPAKTTCNILGSKTAATINRITNVSAVKNYYGLYDISITAEVELPSYVDSREPGFFTVCLIDFDTNTTVMSGQISYSGYGKQRITFEMEDVVPGDYAVMFMSIDIHM